MPANILVVDDEPQLERLILQRFRKQIKNNEYMFSFAGDGLQALEMINGKGGFDVALTDINMPRMDGLTFLKQIKQNGGLTKTVIVSAYGDMKNIRTAMNRGAYDFVTKPIDFEDLTTTLEKALEEVRYLKMAAEIKEELNTVRKDLLVAQDVQQSIIPNDFKIFPEASPYQLYARMIPAKEVGGDFYDFFKIDENKIGIVIADVSGKGMPAALFMAISRTLVKAVASKGESPASCLSQVNDLLSQDNPRSMFVTLIYGVLDVGTGQFEYCNAGHNPPFIVTGNGNAGYLETKQNVALGIVEGFGYASNKIELNKHDLLFFYTDGISEAINKNHSEFSVRKIKEFLARSNSLPLTKLIDQLIVEVRHFSEGVQQSDDITALAVRSG